MTERYRSAAYAPELVTGRYVQRLTKRDGPGYRVFETATGTGHFAGRPGHGPTLREYDTDGAELPDDVRDQADDWRTVLWPLGA